MKARAAARADGGERDVRHRHAGRAGAGAHLRAGERLAHHRARLDGAGRRLDRRATAAAVAALARRHHGRHRGGAHRLRAAHRRRRSSAPRRSSTGCSTAMAFRPRRSGSAASCCAGAPTTLPARMVDSGAILFTVLLAFLEIRHYVNGGDMYRPWSGVVEIMLYVNVGLAMTIGLERRARPHRQHRPRCRRAARSRR